MTGANGTRDSYRAAIAHLIRYMGDELPEEGLLPKRRRNPKDRRPQRGGLLPNELRAYRDGIATLPDPYRTILQLLPWSALRITETCQLPMDAVATRDGRLMLEMLGKGDVLRLVPMHREASAALTAYIGRRRNSPWVFPSPQNPDRPVSAGTVRAHLRRLREASGWDFAVTPHVLRHTALTNLVKRGVDVKTIQAIAGHSSVLTTMIYLHPDTEMLIEAMDKLEG